MITIHCSTCAKDLSTGAARNIQEIVDMIETHARTVHKDHIKKVEDELYSQLVDAIAERRI